MVSVQNTNRCHSGKVFNKILTNPELTSTSRPGNQIRIYLSFMMIPVSRDTSESFNHRTGKAIFWVKLIIDKDCLPPLV